MEILFFIIIIAYSIILHEISHGFIAYKLGDPTAKYEGRLTLNPISHIDPFGTILLPLATYLLGGFIFGWAKPVPYNPYNLKNPSRDAKLIALAGPLTNFIIAVFLSLLIKLNIIPTLNDIFIFGVRLNLLLCVFNLVPIPPLDGSKLLIASLPIQIQMFLELYGFILVFIFIALFFPLINFVVNYLFHLLI